MDALGYVCYSTNLNIAGSEDNRVRENMNQGFERNAGEVLL